MLCEQYSAALLDMNVLAADVRETEQQKHVDQVKDDAKVTFLNQIREQIQSAAQLVIESKCGIEIPSRYLLAFFTLLGPSAHNAGVTTSRDLYY